ncbi:MAG: response regulator [Magnetococcales bacterium]|nr:response regulator [Magnetococcales bacterium]
MEPGNPIFGGCGMKEGSFALLKKMAQGMPVLFVEDDPRFRRQTRSRLEDLGFVVTTANDGWEGSLAFDRGSYPLVVTDYEMPGRSGVELIRDIRKRSPSTHIIILTSLERNEEVKGIFHGDLMVYLVAKSGIERAVVGLDDAVFMALARISLTKPGHEKLRIGPDGPPAT